MIVKAAMRMLHFLLREKKIFQKLSFWWNNQRFIRLPSLQSSICCKMRCKNSSSMHMRCKSNFYLSNMYEYKPSANTYLLKFYIQEDILYLSIFKIGYECSITLATIVFFFSSSIYFFVVFLKLHIPGCLPKEIWTSSKNGGCLGLSQQGEIRCGFAGNGFRENKRIGEESEVLKPM